MYTTNGPDDVRCPIKITDYVQLYTCFCIVIITYARNCMAMLILLNNTLCLLNALVVVWLLQKPLCGYCREDLLYDDD